MKKYKILKDFITKKGKLLTAGMTYDLEFDDDNKFYASLLKNKFIEELVLGNLDDIECNTIKSKLANVIIAGCDYEEGDKKHFTWDEAMALKDKLPHGWRLPTRSEWALICEEFGQKDGRLDADTLIKNLGIGRHGYLYSGKLNYAGNYGRYWSSTPHSNGTNAYNLYFDSGVSPSDYNLRYNGTSVRLVKDMEE